VEPLSRALALQPEDNEIRSMLGTSCFRTGDYARTLQVLQPMEASVDVSTPLGLALTGAEAIAGDYAKGLAGLKTLELERPEDDLVHRLLGEAYARMKNYVQAEKEFQTALRLNPSSMDAKFGLAMTDLGLGKRADAQGLLSDLAKSGSKDGEVYYRLGKLQMELGQVKAAVGSLQTAVSLRPGDAAYHRGLAEALKKNDQPQESEREARKAEALQAESTGHS
jgi:cytochrome c-type biogenesis protein CcmH/NrfG